VPCFFQGVPSDLSLAAVRHFIWKQPDDLVLQYRILDPAKPAPLPKIEPT
jgi:hypothetical protein